jgi:hypothetical protein
VIFKHGIDQSVSGRLRLDLEAVIEIAFKASRWNDRILKSPHQSSLELATNRGI